MATGNIGKKLQSEITCFVCSEYLIQPVTLECGHNFCHACIVKCWAQVSDGTSCPWCRVAVPRLNFKPNGQLANAVQLIRQLSDQAKQMARRSKTCQGHEPAMSFCKDDLVPICIQCDGSQEHEAHNVISVAQAAEEYKGQVLSCIESLRKEKEVIMEHLSDTDKQSQDLIQLVEAEEKKVVDGFNHLHQLVLEQSTFWLSKVEEVKMEITLKTNDQMAVISKELFVLDYIIQDLVEKCDQPVLEFLENVRSILECYKEKKNFENPVVFPPEIKHEIWGLQNFSAFLPGAVKQFEEVGSNREVMKAHFEELYQFLKEQESFLLSGMEEIEDNIAQKKEEHINQVSKELCPLEAVIWELQEKCQQPIKELLQKFNTGRYYWEVTVGSEDGWGLGVAKASVKRKGIVSLDPREGIWAIVK
ncbi:zinc finger protein RFP-like [Pseudonaja textilis]|uniref:zinc finger protein RFP-like n=1 Tax=Pseudonaja textilis TaxID=8673 RepID=UPI000EA9733B|nr:zinc finger protein RFP-like [Pseudonaja textilis]